MTEPLLCRVDNNEDNARKILLARDFSGIQELAPIVRVLSEVPGITTKYSTRDIVKNNDKRAQDFRSFLEGHIRAYFANMHQIPIEKLLSVFDPFQSGQVQDFGIYYDGTGLTPETIMRIGFNHLSVYPIRTGKDDHRRLPLLLHASSLFRGDTRCKCRLYGASGQKDLSRTLKEKLSGILYPVEFVPPVDI